MYFFLIAAIFSFILMIVRKKKYPEIQVWKMAVMMIWVSITGILALKILSFIEKGTIGGDSMFGAVFFMPVFMMPMTLLKISYKDVMNLYAPTQILGFAIVKIDCLLEGCCMGRYLPSLNVQFPSQIADMLVGIAVIAILLWIEHRKPWVSLYPWLMVIFGSARFVVDWFRYVPKPWKWGLPPTILWSLISILVGSIWLLLIMERKPVRKKKGKKNT